MLALLQKRYLQPDESTEDTRFTRPPPTPFGGYCQAIQHGFAFYADDVHFYLSLNSLSGDEQIASVAQIESCVLLVVSGRSKAYTTGAGVH